MRQSIFCLFKLIFLDYGEIYVPRAIGGTNLLDPNSSHNLLNLRNTNASQKIRSTKT